MRRTLRIGAGLGLALFILTCTDRIPSGPGGKGATALNVAALGARGAGDPLIPVDSLRITLTRLGAAAPALDTTLGFRPDTATGDSGVVQLDVPLNQNSEDFALVVTAFGGGVTWYRATDTVRITAGQTAPASLQAFYVGPGANAVRVTIAPTDTTVVGGQPFPLRATVYDSSNQPIAGVPVGYRLDDTTFGTVTYASPYNVTYAGPIPVRDSAWLIAQTPTHLKDSTRVHVVPPAAQLVTISGCGQTGIVNGVLSAPLVVRVLDALGGGFPGYPVTWAVIVGSGTLSATTTATDSSGYASVTFMPTTLGAVTVQAAAAGLGGSPVACPATVIAGAIRRVILDRVNDTIPKGNTLQYTATLQDSLGNTVPGTAAWTSTVPSIATVNSSGLATALAGDSTKIIAAAGGFADTALLYVRALRTIAVSPADTVITAVGDSLLLTATPLDNFGDTITSGVVIRYVSTTPTVATVNPASGRVNIVGPGNAVVLARDTLTGTQGPATLRVNQVPVALVNTGDSLLIGIQGRGQIVARALDRNGYPIPGRTLFWVSRNTGIATVDQFGVVTGVALGSAFVVDSLVDSAGVFKDSTRVDVVPSPPALIQWAFDSTVVGNGGSFSVALSLSRTDPNPLVVKLTSSDTFKVKTTTRTVTIPANQPGTTVTITGLAFTPTPVTVIAEDSSGFGYQPDTMLVNVVSTIEFREIGSFFRQTNFYVNRNETHRAQVFLSDPAPAGGLGVTFVYGRPGTSVVAPSPAIIPAGQLAADVVIQGLTAGRDSLVPTSGGFVGRHSYVDVAPESLRIQMPYPYNGTLGVGQKFQPYVYYTYSMDHPLAIAMTLSPAIGTVPTPVTVPSGTYYAYFDVGATSPGSATLSASAPGWIGTSATVIFTTPRLQAVGTSSIVAGDPTRGYWYAYTEDSLGYTHAVGDTVSVAAVSRNSAAVAVDDPTGQVLPGNAAVSVANALRALPTAGGDSAWIVLTAPGYQPDSFLVRVTPPTLTFAYGYPYDGRVGLGTLYQNAGYVQIPYVRPDTFRVVFGHSRRGVLGGPDSVAILPGQTLRYFDVQGDSAGVDTLGIVRATGYAVTGGPLVYRTDPLRVAPYSYPTTLYTISPPARVNAYAYDSVNGQARPLLALLTVNLSSLNPAAFTLDSPTVRIPAGAFISNDDTLRVVGGDTIGSYLVASAAGMTPDSSGLIRVLPTPLTIGFGYPYTVGRGLKLQNNYVTITGGNAPDTIRVALQNLLRAIDSLSRDTVLIPRGQNFSQYFEILGLDTTATDTIVATATGYVTNRATIRPQSSRLDVSEPGANRLTTDPPFRLRTYTETRNGLVLKPIAPVTYRVVSSNPNVIRIDSAGPGGTVNGTRDTASAVVDTALAYSDVWISFVGSGTAKLYVSTPGFDPDSSSPTTVTGPSLNLAYATVTVGTGQLFTSQYVYVSNPVPAPLTVRLVRSDSQLPPASQAFTLSADSVVIPTNGTSSPFFEIGGNAIGSANLVALATGYSQAVSVVSVGQPQLLSTLPTVTLYVGERPRGVNVYTTDQSGSIRVVAAPTVVAGTSSDPTVATTDSASRTIPARQSFTTFNIRPLKKASVDIVFSSAGYKPDTTVVTVDTAKLALTNPPNGLGPGQVAQSQMYVQLPYNTDSTLVVSLASTDAAVLTVPASVTIPANSYYAYLDVTGVGKNTAAVIATAPHSFADTQAVVIGTPQLAVSLSASTSAGLAYTITVSTRDSLNVTRNVTAPLTVTLVSSNPGHTAFTTNPITIAAGSSSASTMVVFDTAGTYTVTASATGYTSGNAVTTTTGALVRMQDNLFNPQTVTIPAGHVVTWRNDGAVTHTTTSDTGLWDVSRTPGQSYSRTFSTAGTFTYRCNIHVAFGMIGTVIVN